jgi:Domain of unknown function (DUF4383)
MHTPTPAYEIRTQKAAIAVSAAFMLAGALGFVPGITRHSALLGVLHVSTIQNVVYLAFGVAGLALARSFTGSRRFLIGGGSAYLLPSVYGLVVARAGSTGFDDVNSWLHLGLAVAMIALGVGPSHTRFRP